MRKFFDPHPTEKTLSLMPTYQCTAACSNCGTLSSPKERTWLPKEHMLSSIHQAADAGYKLVVFTGGEATLAGDSLLDAISLTRALGMFARLVTNAHWATNPANAEKKVRELVDAGLCEINYSTGDQHARFVPLARVFFATRAALAAAVPVSIMVETTGLRKITKELIESHPDYRAIVDGLENIVIRIIESPWMPLSAAETSDYPEGMTLNRDNIMLRAGCDSILSTTTVQADGRIGACCGIGMRKIPELHIGSIGDTSLIAADRLAENDFLKRWLRVEGPEKILAWAAGHDKKIKWENIYAHKCQACVRIYSDPLVRAAIAEHHLEKVPDVVFGEWLLFHCKQAAPSDSQALDCVSATKDEVALAKATVPYG